MDASKPRLCRLIYFSSVSSHLQESDLDDILAESIKRNERDGITGLLAYDQFNFMQVLEGEEDAVNRLYLGITADPRHQDVRLIQYEQIDHRQFDDWAMALAKLPEVPGNYINKLYGGFKPQLFSTRDALIYFNFLRNYLKRAA
ncbi:MAG TPA: blue light sensor protein [Marinobacter adhaerens]|nr:blue light sensor protein [Marinobacter adhaerens]